jgi:hypothetical protein
MAANNDEFVSILVPRRHVMAVYGFIGTLDAPVSPGGAAVPKPESGSQVSPDSDTSRSGSDDARSRLTPELVKRIYDESPTAMQEILKFLAAHSEQEFSTRDLGQALSNTDIKPNTVAGTFGAFGRRMKNRYGLERVFPFTSRWDLDDAVAYHKMPADMAEIIIAL